MKTGKDTRMPKCQDNLSLAACVNLFPMGFHLVHAYEMSWYDGGHKNM